MLGGSGFIGRNCVEHFAKDPEYKVTYTYFTEDPYPEVENAEGFKVNLLDPEQVQWILQDQDIVIQAAATTTGSKDVVEKPYYHVTDNAVMNSYIFRDAVIQKVKHLIFFSCTVMYQPMDKLQTESDWSAQDRIYDKYFGVGNTKVYLENMCDFYSGLGDTKFTAIRHSNVFGPYDKYDLDKCHVVPAFVNKVINAEDTLDVWGSGGASRDIIYIDDLVNFVDKAIRKQESKYELFNCGLGKAYSIRELASMIMDVNDKELELKFDPSKPDIPTTVIIDSTKAKNILGWEHKTDIKEALKKTSEWYKQNYDGNKYTGLK